VPDPQRPDAHPVRFTVTDLDDPVARTLEQQHSAEMSLRYGGGGEIAGPPINAAQFRPPSGTFVVAWRNERPVACAGIRALGGRRAELKRFFVAPEARRAGVGFAMFRAVEDLAREIGYAELWLETGMEQPEALALYEQAGYTPIPPYGEYQDYEDSRCFARPLTPRSSRASSR